MKKVFTLQLIIISLFTAFHLSASAQVVEPPKPDTVKKIKADIAIAKQTDRAQSVYFEVGGPGLALTINYDARFSHKRAGLGYRVGTGYFASGGNNVFTVPLQLNYLFGREDSKSFFELGGGTTFLNSHGDNKGKTFIFDRVTGFIGTATIGYRIQPRATGFNFRIGFVPIFYDEGIIAAGGASFGYNFK
jgi:hypothetical protein